MPSGHAACPVQMAAAPDRLSWLKLCEVESLHRPRVQLPWSGIAARS
jgi:hypothetical protein